MASTGKGGKFKVIIADPPWKFTDKLAMSSVKRGAGSNYDELTETEIRNIPVGDWCADDAVLALWTPGAFLGSGLEVMKRWGFRQKQVVIWAKVNGLTGKRAFNMGWYFRSACELAIIGTRGSPKPVSKSERNIFEAPSMKPHSRKPDCLHASLARMYPGGPFLELFATQAVPGWTCVGLKCEGEGGIKADLRTWKPG
jgi:N6-adenosine-specific RNA methylase IME4